MGSKVRERTETEIVRAMMTLLQTKRTEEIKVDDICQMALIHRSTFYRYFRDKYEVVELIMNQLTVNLIDGVQNEQALINQIMQFFYDHLTLINHLIPEDQSSYYPEFEQMLERLFHTRISSGDYFQDSLVKVIQSSRAPELMVSFLATGIIGTLTTALRGREENLDHIQIFLEEVIDKLDNL